MVKKIANLHRRLERSSCDMVGGEGRVVCPSLGFWHSRRSRGAEHGLLGDLGHFLLDVYSGLLFVLEAPASRLLCILLVGLLFVLCPVVERCVGGVAVRERLVDVQSATCEGTVEEVLAGRSGWPVERGSGSNDGRRLQRVASRGEVLHVILGQSGGLQDLGSDVRQTIRFGRQVRERSCEANQQLSGQGPARRSLLTHPSLAENSYAPSDITRVQSVVEA
jgi:hypothetical protein